MTTPDDFDADLKALAIVGEPIIGDNERRYYQLEPLVKQMAEHIAEQAETIGRLTMQVDKWKELAHAWRFPQ